MCKAFGTLPWPGSLLQQPKGVILRLEAVLDAQDKFAEYSSKEQTPEA